MAFVRRSIWELETFEPGVIWDPYTVAYARAVEEMRSRPDDDPTSWSYQAGLHGTYAASRPGFDQCQHGSWYFLPWHRIYLLFFERIVRSIVRAQHGPDDWALPFWNYSAGGETASLPPAFREPTWDPDGTGPRPNPLFTDHRRPSYNAGGRLPDDVVSLDALDAPNFSGPPLPGFGGTPTGWSHWPPETGDVENVPHNQVHVQVGGDMGFRCEGGWMTDVNCAAEDPIFWLHHANIDRLWSVWNDAGHTNPDDDPDWRDVRFTLFDETGAPATKTPGEVSSLAALDYEYEPQQQQRTEAARMARPEPPGDSDGGGGARRGAPRLVAASDSDVDLSGGTAEVEVSLARQAGSALRAAADPDDDSVRYVYLQVEGLTAETTPGVSWEVRLTLPDDAPGGGGDRAVGLISFFGAARASAAATPDDEHGLGPAIHRFDITSFVGGLGREEWADLVATVRFVPVGPGAEDAITGSPRVGRVSITAQ